LLHVSFNLISLELRDQQVHAQHSEFRSKSSRQGKRHVDITNARSDASGLKVKMAILTLMKTSHRLPLIRALGFLK
jgi:hypothetical protein